MFKNEYTLNVDIKRKFTALVPTFVQNDTATLKFKIFNNGLPYDLSSFTNAEVTTQRKDGNVVIGKAYIEGSAGNQYIRYEYLGNEMAESGFAQTTLTIFSDTTRVSILPFKINIVADIRDAIGASEEYGVLQDLIVRVEDVLDNIGSVVDNANQAVDSANQAVIDANQAIIDADNAVSLATANAILANEAANNADAKATLADDAAINANTKAAMAEEKAQLADTAALSANNAILGIDKATDDANQATINANSAAQNTNDAITNTNTAIVATNDAIYNANQATSDALVATQNTIKATSDALTATQNTAQAITLANTAASNTNIATTNANKATTEANLAKDGALMAIASAATATQNANTSATNAQLIADNTISKGSFVLGNAYKKNNLILDNGSSWIAKTNTQNNPLPILPIDENTWWKLVAQRGVDGTGSVVSVNSIFPDVNGNVTLDLGDSITKVDGFTPDANGNVVTHTNKDVLDKFSESNGNPQYNGTPIGAVASVNGQTGVVTGLETVTNSDNKLSAKVDKVAGKQLSTEDFTTSEKTKLSGIATNANNYSHPSTHPPSIIAQDASNRFMTDTEKTKLSGIAANANNYTHPANHPASIITQDANNRFVTDTEKTTWNAKVSTSELGDISQLQTLDKSNLVNAMNELNSDVAEVATEMGDLEIEMNNKTGNLLDSIGDMSALETVNTTDLVKAINEINAKPTGGDTTEIAKQINTLYDLTTGLMRYRAYDELLKQASNRIEGGTVFAHDMNGNIIGMTLDEANSQNIVIRDGKMLMINKGEVTKTVTDATVVASAYDTSGNGGRKLVRLVNGWLVAFVKDSASVNRAIKSYISKNNGISFEFGIDILSTSGTINDHAAVSKGNVVYLVISLITTTLSFRMYDVITGTNVSLGVDSAQTAMGNCSLTINPEGTELHAAWSSKNATYPNSFNIRYAKGVISQVDSSVTWGTVEQLTKLNDSKYNETSPSIVLNGNNVPAIIYSHETTDSTNKAIKVLECNSGTFIDRYVYNGGGTYAQSSPSAIFVPKSVNGLANGRIWVAWHGTDATDTARQNIRVSYSDDGGVSWSAMQKLTIGNVYWNLNASITFNKNNEIFLVYEGKDATKPNEYNVSYFKNTSGSWGAKTRLTTVASDPNYRFPSALVSSDLDFSIPLIVYVGVGKVGFYGTWKEPVETPSLTAKAVYDIPSTDFVGAFVKKLGATNVQAYVNDVLADAELENGEYQFTKQLASKAPVKLRLDLSRASTTGGESDYISRILGGRS